MLNKIEDVSSGASPELLPSPTTEAAGERFESSGAKLSPELALALKELKQLREKLNRAEVAEAVQAAKVIEIITTAKLERKGMSPDPEFLKGMSDHIINQVDKQSTATFLTARLWDDGIIDPRDTRKVLAYCLAICRDAQERELHPNSFGVGRM